MTIAHLNLKFSVADTDLVLDMARGGATLSEIEHAFARQRRIVTHGEIDLICSEARVYVRRHRRLA